LHALYGVYQNLVEEFVFACERGCSVCCTHNVLATTAEVDLMMDFVAQIDRPDLVTKMRQGTQGKRMRPRMTLNALAECCLRREEPPDPINDYDFVPCPLREPDGCPVYPARPFACRSLWSTERCAVDGAAVPDSLLLTLNGVFEQLIEHMDAGGLAGNMIDLFSVLSDQPTRTAYQGGQPVEAADHVIATRANPGLLVPPAHRSKVMRALHLLDRKEVQGVPFRQAMNALRACQQ